MALVHDSLGDFVLFPRDRFFLDHLAQPSANYLDNFSHSSTAMDYHSQFAGSTRTTYDSYPVTTAYATSGVYHEAPRSHLNSLKAGDEGSMPRPTPSASPSSMSQTFDQPPSVLSSTSGASAQSAASSVGGSPYARPAQHMPFQDKWSDPIQGLGISPGVAGGEYLGYDTSHQDFVGEYQDILSSSLSSIGPSVSSVSLGPALQEYSSPFDFPRSETPTDCYTKQMAIDTILRESKRETLQSTPLSSPSLSTRTLGPSPVHPVSAQDIESPTERTMLSPSFHETAPVSPQLLSMSPPQSNDPFVGLNTSHSNLTPLSTSPTFFRKHSDPFFNQSSGRFVAPLHSSCWFSFAS